MNPWLNAVYVFSAFFVASLTVVTGAITEKYFENECGNTINIGKGGGVMSSGTGIFNSNYGTNKNCQVTLTADIGRQILITWYKFDVEKDGGCSDTLKIYNGVSAAGTTLNKADNYCGSWPSSFEDSRCPSVTSITRSLTIALESDSTDSRENFKFVYTSIKIEPCGVSEFKCDNGNCIDESLTSDKGSEYVYDNCGDASDTNWDDLINAVTGLLALGLGILIAVIVGCIVGGILICVCCGCLCYHLCCKKQPANTVTVVHAQPPPGPV